MTEAFDFDIPLECFKQVCRVCLKKSEFLMPIHEVVLTHNHNTQGIVQGMLLSIVLKKYCNVLVHKEDLKPENICMECAEMIAKAFDVFEQFLMSNIHLDKILKKHASKLSNESDEDTLSLVTMPTESDEILNECKISPSSSVENIDQSIEQMDEDEDFDDQDIKLEECESKSPHIDISSVIVNPPNIEEKAWDHTYYLGETKLLNTKRRLIRKRKSKQPNSRKPNVVSKSKEKKLLSAYKQENEIFNCKFCKGTVLQGIDNVIKHMQSVHPLENGCLLCAKKFIKTKFLVAHVASHAQKRHLVCTKCFIFFKDKESLEAHTATEEHIKNATTCNICSKSFKYPFKVKQHIQEVHHNIGQQKTQCPKCGVILKYRSNLQRHLRTHLDISERQSFLCEHCAKSFRISSQLKRHMLIEHSGQTHLKEHYQMAAREARRRYKEKFLKNTGYSAKAEIHYCDYCPKNFTSKGTFFKHRISHPGCKDIACPFCEKVFDSVTAYKNHRITDHNAFICSICRKGWPNKITLSQHMNNTHKGYRFQCSFCPRLFKNAHTLKAHENIHTQVKPYSCQYCDKKFTQHHHVIQHEVCIHTKMKKHKCHICDKAFQYYYSLKAHIRLHNGFKPFKCPYCSKNFTDTVGRHKHVKFFHPEKMDDFKLFKKNYQGNEILLADVTDIQIEKGENVVVPKKHASFSSIRKKNLRIEQAEKSENEHEEESENEDEENSENEDSV